MRLLLYGTEHCHLCDEAESLIYRALEGQIYDLKKIDISESDDLMDKYALCIPVLGYENKQNELCWPFLDEDVQSFAGC